MEPQFRELHNTIAYDYKLKEDIIPEAFEMEQISLTSAEQDRYRPLGYLGISDFLTDSEITRFIEAYNDSDSAIHKGVYYINKYDSHNGFFQICGVNMPQEFYEIHEIKLDHLNFYDFSGCRDYFITYANSLWQMNLLINEGFDKGYELIFRDPMNFIVEMKKSEKNTKINKGF